MSESIHHKNVISVVYIEKKGLQDEYCSYSECPMKKKWQDEYKIGGSNISCVLYFMIITSDHPGRECRWKTQCQKQLVKVKW